MSLHADATAVLTGWEPPDPGQATLRETYLRHLRRHPDGVWRSCRPDHLTASALVLSADRAGVLLTLHGKVRRWLQLGGHCEPGDATLAAAARREAVEESGIAGLVLDEAPLLLSHHEVPCGPVRPAHHLDVQYVAHAPADATAVRSAESDDLRWFGVDALPTDTDGSVRALVHHALRRPAHDRVRRGPRPRP